MRKPKQSYKQLKLNKNTIKMLSSTQLVAANGGASADSCPLEEEPPLGELNYRPTWDVNNCYTD